ncbi:MAG: tannase/feruloyl esterase family alpha/beta hydrolase [Myxococcales bacterium]
MLRRTLLVIAPAVSAAALSAPPAIAATCSSLTALSLPHATVTLAQSVPAGSFTAPSGQTFTNLPAFCRVAVVSTPSPDSHIGIEVWLPASGWNGRYQQSGNGGFAGAVPFGSLAGALAAGYAAAGTDDGHTGGTATFAPGHHQQVIDFGFRALKETTDSAKAVIAAFYGSRPARSYFVGCSDGGREALMEAQRFPEDFDGISAGAPANDWTHLFTGFIWNEQALFANPASTVGAQKLPAIQAAALAQCDALDGIKDGLLNDPRRCRFDPAVIQCTGAETDNCLTAAQVAAVRKIYAGPRNPRTGQQIFPGYEAGAEAAAGGWSAWITGPFPLAGAPTIQAFFGNQFFTYIVYEDPAWDYRTMNFDFDVSFADNTTAGTINSTDPDLSRFRAHGGRLIQWHGWDDPAIAPRSSINYFQGVVARSGNGDRALRETQDFYRLFLAPGVLHCGGGPGPNVFDTVSPLVQWVEQGRAPERITATKYNGDDPTKGVAMTRPLCPFPQFAEHKGKGSTNDAANFVCRAHDDGDHDRDDD